MSNNNNNKDINKLLYTRQQSFNNNITSITKYNRIFLFIILDYFTSGTFLLLNPQRKN